MRAKYFSIYLTVLMLTAIINNTNCSDHLSIDYAKQYPTTYLGFGYTSAVVATAFEQLYLVTGDSFYYRALESSLGRRLSDYGEFLNNYYTSWSSDNIREACQVLTMYRLTGDEGYRMGADTVFHCIQNAQRNSYGVFWHKYYYENETLLDGIYMAEPYYAGYNSIFNRPELQDDVVHQVAELYAHVWDPVKKLPYHSWYDYENDPTADYPYWDIDKTGVSTIFWGRGIGWYAMAMVDILDVLPKDYSMRDSLIGLFSNLAEGIAMYQDPDSLVWWQVVDQGDRDSNWVESSASCMYVYALAKGVRMGYIDSTYLEIAKTGYQGIVDKFLLNIQDELTIRNVCEGTIAGPDYAYYVNRAKNYDGHASGAFILASIEMEMMDSIYPPGLLGVDTVVEGAITISWYKNQHNILGYILERKADGEFTKIAELGADSTCFADSSINPDTDYTYRVRAYTQDDTSRWSNYLKVTSANVGGLPSQAYSPSPVDNRRQITAGLVLKWKKGLLTDYHKLYLGTVNPPPFVADIYTSNTYTPEDLDLHSVYYWRVDEVNEKGITTGETWKFNTKYEVSSTESLSNSKILNIYPNPGSEELHVEGLERNSVILIYDLKGMIFYNSVAEKENLLIDMHNWQKGIYVIQIRSSEGIIYKKLIRE